jgi:hypothetical protein
MKIIEFRHGFFASWMSMFWPSSAFIAPEIPELSRLLLARPLMNAWNSLPWNSLTNELPRVQYFLAAVSFLFGARILYREGCKDLNMGFGIQRQRLELQKIYQRLQEIEELFGAGMVPERKHWEQLMNLPAPWGTLTHDSLQDLRASGGAVLPTLRRLKDLASHHSRVLADAKARSSQALAQAIVCALLIPVFAAVLYMLLPGVSEHPWLWIAICGVALVIAGFGSLWLLSMVQEARWAGLPRDARSWVLASQCAGERFLALIRAGIPADLAWGRAMELLSREAPSLAMAWGHSVWKSAPVPNASVSNGTSRLFLETGESLRRAVQVSLMEGRPCSERVEGALASLSHEIKARIEAELTLLSTRALKPLFLCVAPGVFILLGVGFFLCLLSSSQSLLGA